MNPYENYPIDSLLALSEEGDGSAQHRLGQCYEIGNRVSQNDDQAFKSYLESAKQGNSKAQYSLGKCYEFGIGGSQRYGKGRRMVCQTTGVIQIYLQDLICISTILLQKIPSIAKSS
jgi:TPR repeat protein